MAPVYIQILTAFILPFAIFILLPLWRNNKNDGKLILMIFAVFLWGVAIGSVVIYCLMKYCIKFSGINFYKSYLVAMGLGILTLIVWVISKKIFKIR